MGRVDLFFTSDSYLLVVYWGGGNGTPLQHSCLENPMDGGAWWAAVHGVAKSWTRLSDFTFTFHFHALEKEMATHSSVLAWRIPGMGEPHGLPSMGSHRVRHDWSDLAAAAAAAEVFWVVTGGRFGGQGLPQASSAWKLGIQKLPTAMHRITSSTKNYPTPNIRSAEVKKAWSRG